MNHFDRLLNHLLYFTKDDSASATVEFVIIAPILFWFVFSTFEIGWLMTQQTMLSRGVNLTVRDLRLGNTTPGTTEEMQQEIKERVCSYARILRDCNEYIHLELIIMETGRFSSEGQCIDLDPVDPIEPSINFTPGGRDPNPSVMLMRVCVLVDLLLPNFGIAKGLSRDNTGRYRMFATTAFANEPA